MVSYKEINSRIKFLRKLDRIGPDNPLTHWKLHFKSSSTELCKKKFKKFGEGSEFRPGAYAVCCSKISIGSNVVIRPGSFLFADPIDGGGEITLEDDVLLGFGVHFYTSNHSFTNHLIPISYQGYPSATTDDSILVKRGSWIGASAIILPGVVIGENSVIGAGTIVTKSVPPHTVFAGNPGKEIKIESNKIN